MSAQLTYRPRDGVIVATAAGQRFLLPVHQGVGADLGSWAQVQGLDLEWEVVEYGVAGPGGMTTRLRRKAGSLPPRHDCSHCVKGASVIFVDDGGAGFFIHGWPPCNRRRCIVLSQGWDNLLRALASEGAGSIRVA
jgi:hypothetical protein